MRILFCSAEVAPFSHVGGLGDVMGSLPRAMAELGEDCSILTPLYGLIDTERYGLTRTDMAFTVHLQNKAYEIAIWQGTLPRSEVPVYFVDNYELFGARQQVYPYGQPALELEGFLVFSQAVFELSRRLHRRPDILHVHDWHTASIATTLAGIRPFDQYFSRTKSVMTIHNLNYQGVFGEVNWLREGIQKADAVTTVSPTYAQEIQTPAFGAGLDAVIRDNAQKVSGIVNGIDTILYNPQTDAFIPQTYDASNVQEGKAACKAALQQELGLPVDPKAPLMGVVGRLADQKGLDILVPVMESLAAEGSPVQWAVLGTGDPQMEETLKALNSTTRTVRTYIGFSTAMARKIYAASDLFVMPSAFEPCGLGQMIAFRYGSVPLVRHVGGLRDTVRDVRTQADTGNGFAFSEYDSQALKETILAALDHYERPADWQALIQRGMAEDHSWRPSAEAYQGLFARLSSPTANA